MTPSFSFLDPSNAPVIQVNLVPLPLSPARLAHHALDLHRTRTLHVTVVPYAYSVKIQPIDGTYEGQMTVNVSVGANDPTTTIICLYGNRLEDAVWTQRDPKKNLEVVVNRAGTQQVAVYICACV
jgi:hypothetical protein